VFIFYSQVHSEDQNVHLVTQMIWGRTTHMGCGWIQFPVEPGSKKFEKIYPEGEYENFFVCNYGVGGNVPGEPVYRCQFHQHFTYKFFVQMSFWQLFLCTCKLPKQRSHKKFASKMLMKLTTVLIA